MNLPLILVNFETIFHTGTEFNLTGLFDFLLSIAIIIVFNLFFAYFIKRKVVLIFTWILSLLLVGGIIFKLNNFVLMILGFLIILVIISLFVNMSDVRGLVTNKLNLSFKGTIANRKKEIQEQKIFDKEEVYKTINEAIIYLSKHKIGALMTFERNNDLSEIMKNGTIINCPVTFELLITIFYPGTRLHDGAVIIKDNLIKAASVYYTPTTKILVGKYGSRHRAGIGISEISDAVTVIVSEETGRISISVNGELESFSIDSFYTAFENIMGDGTTSNPVDTY